MVIFYDLRCDWVSAKEMLRRLGSIVGREEVGGDVDCHLVMFGGETWLIVAIRGYILFARGLDGRE